MYHQQLKTKPGNRTKSEENREGEMRRKRRPQNAIASTKRWTTRRFLEERDLRNISEIGNSRFSLVKEA